jgi:putative transposase
MGGKKIKGRKRAIAVDTMGNLHEVVAHAATIADCEGGAYLVQRLAGRREDGHYPRLEKVMGDSSYGKGGLERVVEDRLGCELDISARNEQSKTFEPKRLRWVVEQVFACLGRNRRLSKDYEYVNDSSETVMLIASISRMLNRLAPNS